MYSHRYLRFIRKLSRKISLDELKAYRDKEVSEDL